MTNLFLSKDELYKLLIKEEYNTPRVSLNDILKQEEQSKKRLEEQKIFDQIMNDLDGADSDVRWTAIQHPKATKQHIDKALEDSDWYVRAAAIHHLNVSKEHLDKGLNDSNVDVRYWAIQHPNVSKQHLDKALNDSNSDVRYAAKEKLKELENE